MPLIPYYPSTLDVQTSKSRSVAHQWNAQHTASTPLEVFVVEDAAGFDALAAEWNELHELADSSVFQSFPWLRGWWKHFGERFPRRQLHLVTIRGRDGLIAVLPLFIQVTRLNALASMRTLHFIGRGISDCLDVITRPGCETEVAEILATHLAGFAQSLDAMDLTGIPDGSLLRRWLVEELASRGLKTILDICDNCPRLTLGTDWEQTVAAASGDFRRKLRARERRLHEYAEIRFETIESPESLNAAMDDFVTLHQERLTDKVGRGIYTEERMEDFHREVCAEFLARGWLFLTFKNMNGRRVFANCYYYHKNHVYCHLGGATDIGEAWNHSPGLVLESHCVREALRRGARIYDFLRGTEPYKYRFGAVNVPLWSITMKKRRVKTVVLGTVGTLFLVAKKFVFAVFSLLVMRGQGFNLR
jgi:CelD/BcsL family acetyltransferase involved in cellulose biosynthesis